MAGRKIRDEHDATTCLEAAACSGVRRTQWAHDNGVDARSLNAWHMNLTQRRRRRQPPPHDAPLRLVELIPSLQREPAMLVLHHGPWTLEVGHDVDEEHLAKVIRAVTAC